MKTNTKLEVKKLNKMKEQIVQRLQRSLSELVFESNNTFSEIEEKIKKIHEISKDPTFCESIPTLEEIDEVHNIHDEHIEELYECIIRYEDRRDEDEKSICESQDDRVVDIINNRDFRKKRTLFHKRFIRISKYSKTTKNFTLIKTIK